MAEISRENKVENLLRDLGFCKYERKAYLTLQKHGPQNYKSLSARLINFLHHDHAHYTSTRDVFAFSVSP